MEVRTEYPAILTETLQLCPCCRSDIQQAVLSWMSECILCGYVFDNPRPTPRSISDFYAKAGKYDHWTSNLPSREILWRRRLSRCEFVGHSVLDVGAGIGQFLSLIPEEYERAGTEISPEAVRIAKQLYGLSLIHGELCGLEFSRTFDNVTLFHVLEHVHQPRSLVEKCASLLNANGRIFVAVPSDLHNLRGKLNRDQGLSPITLNGEEIHLSHFTPKSLRNLLASCGFHIIHEGLDPFWDTVGPSGLKERLWYGLCSAFFLLTGRNIYETIWMVAEKRSRVRYATLSK